MSDIPSIRCRPTRSLVLPRLSVRRMTFPGMRFETITLAEPPLRNGPYGAGSTDRRAFLAVYDTRDGSVYEATVSLSQRRVLDWQLRPGARPRIAAEEFLLAERAVKSDARFLAALMPMPSGCGTGRSPTPAAGMPSVSRSPIACCRTARSRP